ncbi:MAG: GNAT family N-acetyltransferase [Chloroflexi bacterium]|nr:GNAT family N-acetyltransferase [Chloroflexota bacterium]
MSNPPVPAGVQPTLETERLILRPFRLADAPEVQRLAGDRAIAETTATIPHPYPDGAAETWIASHPNRFASGESVTFAITRRDDGALLGCIGLEINTEMQRTELGYWVGKPYWNHGYCTEAAWAVVRFAFEDLGLRRVFAQHDGRNAASGRVMQKAGMRHEGTLRHHNVKWGVVDDMEVYGVLREKWRESA